MTTDPAAQVAVDLNKWPNAQRLVDTCNEFLSQVMDLTPGHELEARLNKEYGPGNPYYEDMCKYIKIGLDEGWVATNELDGPKYRRSRIAPPSADNRYMSITTVYFDSKEAYAGQHHAHPYGEINCVVALSNDAQLEGFQGWQGPGWTSPAPGTHHFPRARGGEVVALFFLPAGRISYNMDPDAPQPISV